MGKKPRVSDDGVKRLAFYFYRANLMRGLTHEMRDYLFAPRRRSSTQTKHAWEFFTYLEHWLSALFVVVEGFNKLKMHDARVQPSRTSTAAVLPCPQSVHSCWCFPAT
jgi:Ni,Fe-hydrogenase I cytochrome b subunit